VDGWEREQAAKAVFTMPDGSVVAIPSDQPLPAAVVDVIRAEIAPSITDAPDTDAAVYEAIRAVEARIYRTVVPVVYLPSDNGRRWFVGHPAPVVEGGFSTQQAAEEY